MSLQMRQNMNVRMEQRLKLTPQMIQSIEILLLPQMALEERIMHEVESNPTLEIDDAATAPERSDDDRAMGEAAAERDANAADLATARATAELFALLKLRVTNSP